MRVRVDVMTRSCAWSKATIAAFARAKRPMPSCAENFLFSPQQPFEAVERHRRAAAHAWVRVREG